MVTETEGSARRAGFGTGWLVPVGIVAGAIGMLVVALVVGGGRPRPAPDGLPDPGMLTGWGLPAAKLAMDLSAVGTVGSLLFGVLAPSRGGTLDTAAARAVRGASGWAWAWAVSTVLTLVFTLSDFLGAPVTRLDYQNTLAGFISQVSQGRALAVVILLTVILAATARNVGTLNGAALLVVLALAAALPPALTGHSAQAADHDLATSSLLVHIVAVTVWVGGLAALAVYGRLSKPAMRGAARRFSTVALWCFVAAAASGLVNAWVGLAGIDNLVTTRYGWLVIGKVVAVGVLGWFGWRQRQVLLPKLERGEAGAFRRFALCEAAVMAATVGLAVALARTPTPSPEEVTRTSTAEALIGYAVPPVSGMRLLTSWRLDLLVVLVAVVAVVMYVRGVLKLRARGVHWPVGRTIAWVGGVGVAVVVLCGGIGTYAPAMFSAHMVQHMTLTMLSPILLAMAAPVTLALRALPAARRTTSRGGAENASPEDDDRGDRGLREWILVVLHSRVVKLVTHPVVALAFYIVSLYAFYFSPLFVAAMRSHSAHLLMSVHFLAVGALYFWPIIGLDPMPRLLPPLGRMLMLFASLPFHAFFGVIVMTSTTVIGAEWYATLKLPWLDPLNDQNLGGGIAWATAEIPALVVLGVVFAQWVRADTREARRLDRRADAGQDDQLAEYNAMLAKLAAKDRRRPHSSSG
ncbi:cytochrome c oxidase assembly protein [Actinopolymorpha alba]|uniref:cytochrome c oxidase assembly protein n=1 Tax=Actinopolymorpha alba TaxID=533267 RepID=UPI0003696079|nr:cytochrome c oxidase assembly protein [Actinopolymorpha alba]